MPVFYRSIGKTGSRDYEWEMGFSKLLFEDHYLTVGMEYVRNEVYEEIKEEGAGKNLTNPIEKHLYSNSLYIQDEWQISEPLLLTLGVRGDFYSDFDNQVSPKISFLYDLTEKTKLLGSFATAYNPPAYYQVFCPDWNMTTYVIRTANPDLEAEKSLNYELGVRHKFSDNFKGTITGFWTEAKDLIQSVSTKRQIGQPTAFPANRRCYMTYEHHENLDEARMRGIEVETELKFTENHKIFANYTFLDAVDRTTGKRLEQRPKHMASFGYNFDWEPKDKLNLWLSLRGRIMDEICLEEWGTGNKMWVNGHGVLVADLSTGIDIGEHLQVFFEVTNISDEKYKEFTYSRYEPGRMIWSGVKVYF